MKIRNEVEALDSQACTACKGRGGQWVANGPDDVALDVCDNCEGTGYSPELGLYWCQSCFNYHCEADTTFADHWPRHKKVA